MHEGTGFDDHEHGVIGGSGTAADTASGRSTQRQMLAEDRIELRSVGVDIGSATSQIIFSRLELEKVGNRYVTVKREALFESPILLTPYAGENSIDAEALGAFIESGYAAAGVDHDEIDTGALILTGVALLRENSWKIAELFAREAGRLVAVSAGDNLEAIMAAYGSGAVDLSRTQGCRILNADIGGGTTKLAVCANGHLEGTLAIDVGARLIVTDEARTIIRIEPAGREVCFHLGLELEIGDELTVDDAEKIADCMTRQVAAAIPRRIPVLDTFLFRGEALDQEQPVGAITFSGGVSEYVYAREAAGFNDLGKLIASKLRTVVEEAGLPILGGRAGIRATVVGASQYTAQVSGSTIYLSATEVLPLRNVPVISPKLEMGETIDSDQVAAALTAALTNFELAESDGPLAFALEWQGSASYERLRALARGITSAVGRQERAGTAVVIVCDDDVGRLVGKHIVEELGSALKVISIDCVRLNAFDFIDVGEIVPGSGVVPVIIKSLVFPALVANP